MISADGIVQWVASLAEGESSLGDQSNLSLLKTSIFRAGQKGKPTRIGSLERLPQGTVGIIHFRPLNKSPPRCTGIGLRN